MLSKIKFIYIPIILVLASGCEPDIFQPEGFASISVTNAVPASPTVDVLVDGKVTSVSRLNYGNTTISTSGSSQIYLPVLNGSRSIMISQDTGKTNITSDAYEFETGKIFSYFVYDTVVNGRAKLLRLNDDLTLPTGSNVHVRFLHLAPNAGSVDVTLVRGTVYDTSSSSTQKLVFQATDSVSFLNQPYVGGSPNIDLLSPFKPIVGSTGTAIAKSISFGGVPEANKNNRYVVKLKTPGTQNVIYTSAFLNFTTGKIYTFYARGTAQSQPLNISAVTNY